MRGQGWIRKRVLKGDRVRYTAGLWVGNRQKTKTFKKKSEATRWIRRTATFLDRGECVDFPKIKLSEFVVRWKRLYLTEKAKTTQQGYISVLKCHILPFFGHRYLTDITFRDVNKLIAEKLAEGCATNSINGMLRCLSSVFYSAKLEDLVRQNPVKDERRRSVPRKPRAARRALSADEIKSLLESANERARLVILVGVLAGLRRGEMMGLKWGDVDFKKRLIGVVRQAQYIFCGEIDESGWHTKKPKSVKGERVIDLSPKLRGELLSWRIKSGNPGDDRFVFTAAEDPESPLPPHSLRYDIKSALKGAGLPIEISYHWLRHTFGSLKLEQGESIWYVSRQMGHASISITCDTYGHPMEHNQAAARRTDEMLFDTTKIQQSRKK